jgi:hypothetical protein
MWLTHAVDRMCWAGTFSGQVATSGMVDAPAQHDCAGLAKHAEWIVLTAGSGVKSRCAAFH